MSYMAFIYILDPNILDSTNLATYLRLSDHKVNVYTHSKDLFIKIEGEIGISGQKPDLIIIEATSPDYDGFLVAKRLLKYSIPFMFITERGEESDRIIGFELGAEEYVVKPYSTKEAALRVEKVLRLINRTKRKAKTMHFKHKESTLTIDNLTHKTYLDNNLIYFTSAEWKILHYLVTNDKVSITRDKLLEECLDFHFNGYKRAIDTHIKKIRAKLLKPTWIETVRGFGYRFVGERVK